MRWRIIYRFIMLVSKCAHPFACISGSFATGSGQLPLSGTNDWKTNNTIDSKILEVGSVTAYKRTSTPSCGGRLSHLAMTIYTLEVIQSSRVPARDISLIRGKEQDMRSMGI